MNRRGHASLKMWLMGAAAIAVPTALGILGPNESAFADGKLPFGISAKKPVARVNTAVATEPPRLLQIPDSKSAEIQTVSDSQTVVAAGTGQKSEVMKQLELLYEKDGREMPDLQTIQPVPTGGTSTTTPANESSTTPPVQPNSAGAQSLRTQGPTSKSGTLNPTGTSGMRVTPQATGASPNSPAATPPSSKNPVTGFFKKLMPGHREPKPTSAGPNYQPHVAPNPANVSAAPARLSDYPPAQIRSSQPPARLGIATNPAGRRSTVSGSAVPVLSPPAELMNEGATPVLSNVAIQPAVIFGLPPSPTGELGAGLAAPGSTTSTPLPPLLTQTHLALPGSTDSPAKALDPALAKPNATGNLTDPFTEMSEHEADGEDRAGPFTGLTLDENGKGSTESAQGPMVAAPQEAAASTDPFADELRKLGILPPLEKQESAAADISKLALPPLNPPSLEGIGDQVTRDKMLKIRERGGMKGLKGFCPVTLHDERELVDAKSEFHSTYRGQKFHFSNDEAKSKFEQDPSLYAPAAYGADVVALTRDKDVVEGSLDYAAWFKGRLYLFGCQDAHDAFVANPVQYATPAGIE